MRKNLAVGHFYNAPFIAACEKYLPRIREVFFAWPGVLSCRPSPEASPENRRRLIDDLKWARGKGIELDTLFNCNCYGDNAISEELADFVSKMLREMDEEGLFPDTVTTTSPFIATILRKEFPKVKIRWSVNQRVHGSVGFEPVLELFDSFYASREIHRLVSRLSSLHDWAEEHGKQIGIQANSGCLRQCPFQTFHDNLHGHNRVAQSRVGEKFGFSVFRCKTNYERGNYEDFLRATWLRPEDLPEYEPYVDIVKLATRKHPDPVGVLAAYAEYSYDGDLTKLTDPTFEFPRPIDNRRLGESELWPHVRNCSVSDNCRHCGICTDLLLEIWKE